MKTSELIDEKLNWTVSKCEGKEFRYWKTVGGDYNGHSWQEKRHYSTDWSQGGPIIEREHISIIDCDGYDFWRADKMNTQAQVVTAYGPTPLIAAMRCYVASKLGDEVEIPKELLGEQ